MVAASKSNPNPRNHYGTEAERLAYSGTKAAGDGYITEAGVIGWDGTAWRGGAAGSGAGVAWSPVNTHDATAVEGNVTTGNSFQTLNVPLTVTGIRAKTAGAATYTFRLWLWDGTLLATVAVVSAGGETVSPVFAAPVLLAVNERYFVSVHSTVGYMGGSLMAGKLPLAGVLATVGSGPLLTPCGAIAWVYPQYGEAGDVFPDKPSTGNTNLVPIEPVFA